MWTWSLGRSLRTVKDDPHGGPWLTATTPPDKVAPEAPVALSRAREADGYLRGDGRDGVAPDLWVAESA
jgi:hypothetical protein